MNKVLVFDVDGTLFDTKVGIIDALNYVLSQYNKSLIEEDMEEKYIGPPIYDSLIKFSKFDADVAKEATSLYRRIYVEKFIQHSVPYCGMEDVLKFFENKGYKLYIATMKTKPQVDRLFSIFGIAKYFDKIYTATENASISKQEMLMEIQSNNEGSTIFMIGDTKSDYEATLGLKCIFVAADYGYGKVSNISSLHISSISELCKII